MRKFFVYLFAFLMIFFLLPALLTNRGEVSASVKEENTRKEDNLEQENTNTEEYDYKQYGIIKLLHKNTNEVEEVPLDKYLCNVVSAEMPADYEKEALKAQAIVARTYTIYKIQNKKHENADICDDSSCCQAWVSKETRLSRWDEDKRESNWKKIEECVNETKG